MIAIIESDSCMGNRTRSIIAFSKVAYNVLERMRQQDLNFKIEIANIPCMFYSIVELE